MGRRVVVTGMGGIASCGTNPKEIYQSVVNQRSGIRRVTKFPIDAYHVCQVAGELDFHIGLIDRIVHKEFKRIAPATQYGMYAIRQALADSHFDFSHLTPKKAQRVGISMGASIIGFNDVIEQVEKYHDTGAKYISALLIQKIMPSALAARPSVHEGIHGPAQSVSAACASSGMAIIDAYQSIIIGECDVVVAGGAEDAIDPVSLASFGNMAALAKGYNDQPTKASRPYDTKRTGFVPSEGGFALILEDLSHALARKAPIYAEIVGYARNSDAFDIVEPDPDGTWQALCMDTAFERAQVRPANISYLNAHGTGTPKGDPPECKAIASVLGKDVGDVPVSSTKGVTGHLMSASAAIELLICIMAINEGVIPPTMNLEVIDPECAGIRHIQTPIKTDVEVAVNNSFGFGGPNSTIVVKKFAA